MDITVAIPAFNEEQSIEKTLRSIEAQQLPKETNLAILVVDDGSSDRTAEIVGALSKEFGNISLLSHETRKGKPAGWNLLHKTAATDLIIFTDADVIMKRGALSSLIETAKAYPKLLAVGGVGVPLKTRNRFLHFINSFPYRYPREHLITGNLYAIRKGAVANIPAQIINEDDYLSETLGRERFAIDEQAQVMIRLPQTLSDYIKQKVRIYCGKAQTARMFGASPAPSTLPRLLFSLSLQELFYVPGYLAVNLYCRIKARLMMGREYAEIWKPIKTGKLS